jgi:hypothetical protein
VIAEKYPEGRVAELPESGVHGAFSGPPEAFFLLVFGRLGRRTHRSWLARRCPVGEASDHSSVASRRISSLLALEVTQAKTSGDEDFH